MYLRARWYDPAVGTFTARDPFAGFPTLPYSLHPYQYGYSNPLLWTDPSGRCASPGDPNCDIDGFDTWVETNPDQSLHDLSITGDFIPFVNDVKGIIEGFTGHDLLTGEPLPLWSRTLGLLCLTELRHLRHVDEALEVSKYGDNVARGITGGRRSPLVNLTDDEIDLVKQEFGAIGGDPTLLRFNQRAQTGLDDATGLIYIRGDIFPLDGATHPRSRMSVRAVLAHEMIHARYLDTPLPPGAWNDEFRASYLAAKEVRNLSDQDRFDLIADAIERAREAGVPIHQNDFIRRTLYGDIEFE